jgi:preprotein translocase subunit SecF
MKKIKGIIWGVSISLAILFIFVGYVLIRPTYTFACSIECQGGLGIQVQPAHNIFQAVNMAPGYTDSTQLEVLNTGSQNFAYTVGTMVSGSADLAKVLLLQIQDSHNRTLYSGALSGLINLHLGSLQAGKDASYTLTVTFPTSAGNQYQGKSTSVNFVFDASQE